MESLDKVWGEHGIGRITKAFPGDHLSLIPVWLRLTRPPCVSKYKVKYVQGFQNMGY